MVDKRKALLDLYNKLIETEKAFFNGMYRSVDEIAEHKIDWAITQCENTLKLPHHVRIAKIDNVLK